MLLFPHRGKLRDGRGFQRVFIFVLAQMRTKKQNPKLWIVKVPFVKI